MKKTVTSIVLSLLVGSLVFPMGFSMAQTAPMAINDTYSVTEDNVLSVDSTLGVLRNDSDAEGDTIMAIIVSGASFGILTLNPDGSLTYTPLPNFNGIDTFSYVANDGLLNSTQADVNITVNPVNDIPVARIDSYFINEDNTLTITNPGVLLNDTDLDGNALTTPLVANVMHGTLSLSSNGGFSYTPTANFNGVDSFTYNANDGSVNSNTATVDIKINSINDTPVASADSYSVIENQTITIAAPGILSNDVDFDGDIIMALLVTNVNHGVLSLGSNGNFLYTPVANFAGVDSFTYKDNDGIVASNTVTVTITVSPVNHSPIARSDLYSVDENQTLTVTAIGVLSNDTDSDGNTLTASLATNVSNGTLTLNPNGSFTYKPVTNFNGMDSFTYNANDGSANSNTVTVTIKINPLNQLPTDDVLLKLLDQIQNLLHRITGLEKDVAELQEKNNALESRVLQLETIIGDTQNNNGGDDEDEEDDNDDEEDDNDDEEDDNDDEEDD
ncbi:MAG: tandem-95 repeat protein [Nitrososphaerales archaeon]